MTYTLYQVHSFTCDHPGCAAEVEDVGSNREYVWLSFEQLGWARDGLKHYCPRHAVKGWD